MKKSKNKGFTLIEIMIVLAILSILYSIAAANVMGLQTEAKSARAPRYSRRTVMISNFTLDKTKPCDKLHFQ